MAQPYQNQQGGNAANQKHILENRVSDILKMDSLSNEGIDSLLKQIQEYATLFAKKLNTSQLRNIFSKVLKATTPLSLKLMRPKIIYVAARQQNGDAKRVVEFFESMIQSVDTEEKVKNYQSFMEAFVAYHKYISTK